jgi:hypothetical protein
MISHENHWIFIHIQKTGGQSICCALTGNTREKHKHYFASELRELYGEEIWASYFKFAFVRNPWDRLVSWWAMFEGRKRAELESGQRLGKFAQYVLANARSFDEFLSNCTAEIEDRDGRKFIFRNQVDYLSKDIDFVGRFENIESDFSCVAKRIGNPDARLPLLNKSKRTEYTSYYTPVTRDLVAEKYARDIQEFGYRFGQ